MVGQLAVKEADIGVSGLAQVLERTEVINFTFALTSALNTITGLKPRKSMRGGYKAFFVLFNSTAWVGFAIMTIIVSISASIIRMNTNVKGTWKAFQCGMVKFGLACMQRGDVISGRLQAWRLLQITTAFCGYLWFTAYTSDLTAILTVGQADQLPKDFQEIIEGGYRILAAKGVWTTARMENSLPGSDMRRAFDSHTTLYAYNGDLEPVLHRMTADPKILYYGGTLPFLKHPNFKIVTDFKEAAVFQLPFGLQKDSEFQFMFNYHIVKMSQAGLFSKLSHIWYKEDKPGDWSERIFVEEATAVGYFNVLFPLLLLPSGALFAIFLAWIEKIEACF